MNFYKIIFTVLVLQLFAFAAPAPVPSDLVAWFAGDGSANDISGNNLNPASVFGTPGFAVGRVGQTMSFNGESGYAVADNDLLDIDGDDSFSIEFWAKTNEVTGTFVEKRELIGGQYKGYVFYKSFNGTRQEFGGNGCAIGFDLFLPNTQTVSVFADGVFCTQIFAHYAVVYDRTTSELKLYINGALAAGRVITNPVGNLSNNANFHIAQPSENSVFGNWNGGIDELSIYKKALTLAEIQAIYNAGGQGKDKTSIVGIGTSVAKTVGDVTATFPDVSVAGTFNQTSIDPTGLPALPVPYVETGLIYDISTTAVYSGNPTLCFNLPAFTDPIQFGRLKVLHLENNVWVDRTTSSNFATHQLCGQTATFSPFAIADFLAPTAANISISGRVLTSSGRGISRARVLLTNTNGEIHYATTNPFGYYNFDEVLSGETYILNVRSKIYQFNSQIITPDENLDGVNFIAN